MKKQERLVFRVQYSTKFQTWVVRLPGTKTVWTCPTKRQAVEKGVDLGNGSWGLDGKPAQLVIHRKDGAIQSERTYGKDPKRTKG
jgi:hypothetical protein